MIQYEAISLWLRAFVMILDFAEERFMGCCWAADVVDGEGVVRAPLIQTGAASCFFSWVKPEKSFDFPEAFHLVFVKVCCTLVRRVIIMWVCRLHLQFIFINLFCIEEPQLWHSADNRQSITIWAIWCEVTCVNNRYGQNVIRFSNWKISTGTYLYDLYSSSLQSCSSAGQSEFPRRLRYLSTTGVKIIEFAFATTSLTLCLENIERDCVAAEWDFRTVLTRINESKACLGHNVNSWST